MQLWTPLETYGRKKRADGATIQYTPFLGYWNSKEAEIAYDKIFQINPEQNLPHYHNQMTEAYFAISGHGVMLLNEEDEAEFGPKELLVVEPREVHRLVRVIKPDKYGPLELLIVKFPSIEGDKFNV